MYLDDTIANTVVDNTPIFAHIHPNYFSCTSIILNFIILQVLHSAANGAGGVSHTGLFLLLGSRFMTDILDGSIARAHNKVTVTGGLLDTAGDFILIVILLWYLLIAVCGMPIYSLWAIVGFIIVYMIREDTLHDHAGYKQYGRDMIRDCVAWMINNTIFLFIGAYFFICGTSARCFDHGTV